MLENALRRFSTLTKGDKFQFLCKGDIFEIAVLDVKPQHQFPAEHVLWVPNQAGEGGGDKEAEEKKPSMFSSGGGQTLRDATNKKRKYEDITGREHKSD
ncbi:hypothetical protein FN846DRAFT_991740 [Sphaerosporella brunnea]|uniref:Uncharacterized protein n=1 Tax=Sphaerosporella brunnea TaxID=1250544 RepID=A0A5J5ENW0_9PEZI|nr:hypothetical protein FN846DRAFT_991740 [Sphaerosporella brunnea]